MPLDETRVGLSQKDISALSPGDAYQQRQLIAGLIRDALLQGGLGQKDPNAPLADIIEPGMTVLVKPNWVFHCNHTGKGMECLITHPVFVEETLREVLKAKPGRIIIGDAPIQSAAFHEIATETWIRRLKEIAAPCTVEVVDFRRCVRYFNPWKITVVDNQRPPDSFIPYDLGADSLLEPISSPAGQFRSTCYDHKTLLHAHQPGTHQYLLTKEMAASDVIINLPKLKCHRKAGLTAALKNLVGINSDKDYLPHHRRGGSGQRGDCYEGNAPLKRISEFFHDRANSAGNRCAYLAWQKTASFFLRLNIAFNNECNIEGAWHGNDTVWRMVLDINRAALYGKADGTLAATPQRTVYSITDAIVAGEKLGPLAPEPVLFGVVTFASSSAFADLLHSALMRFDWQKIPQVHNAFNDFPYPLVRHAPSAIAIHAAGKRLSLAEAVAAYSHAFQPSQGWEGHIEMKNK